MNIDHYLNEWELDGEINAADLISEMTRIVKLQTKYLRYRNNEALLLQRREQEYYKLRTDKYEYYSTGSNEETNARGWPFLRNSYMKSEVKDFYLNSDPDISNLALKIAYSKEIVKNLDLIISMIAYRSNMIKEMMKHHRFIEGRDD